MKALTEEEAYLAVTTVLCEPDPACGDARQRLLPGLLREFRDAHAKYLDARGEVDRARAIALGSLELPYPVSATLAQKKAQKGIKIASDITWFLYSAITTGNEQHATVTAACTAWAARNRPGLDPSEQMREVQKHWRRYRPAAHIAAAYRAFLVKGETAGYVNLLAIAEALLDRLEVRVRTAPQPLLDRSRAWVVPNGLGLLRAELNIAPADISRLIAPQS
jgi:hypothetical protein